jgi:hypothetical protein
MLMPSAPELLFQAKPNGSITATNDRNRREGAIGHDTGDGRFSTDAADVRAVRCGARRAEHWQVIPEDQEKRWRQAASAFTEFYPV